MRLGSALALALVALSIALCEAQTIIVVYGSSLCPECNRQKEDLKPLEARGFAVFFFDTLNATIAEEFYRLYELLVGNAPTVPLILVLDGGRLRVVAVGYHSSQAIQELLEEAKSSGKVLLSSPNGVKPLGDERAVSEAESILEARLRGAAAPEQGAVSVGEVLPAILILAAVDSVKPCTFIVYTTLLLSVAAASGKRGVLYSSAGFVLSIYACYYLLGIGLITLASLAPQATAKWFAALGLAFGTYLALANARGRLRSFVPRRLLAATLNVAESAPLRYAALLGGAVAGALASLTLVPCAGGPLLVSAALLSRVEPAAGRYALLALYNAVFVSPLAALSAAFTAIVGRQLKERTLALMQAAAGALLAATCLYVLLAY
mgnify:CR=1 FL=1